VSEYSPRATVATEPFWPESIKILEQENGDIKLSKLLDPGTFEHEMAANEIKIPEK
jgi:hypothetical protein